MDGVQLVQSSTGEGEGRRRGLERGRGLIEAHWVDRTLPGLILISHSLHALASNTWSPVSEHSSLVHSMEACISVPGAWGPGRRQEGGESSRVPVRCQMQFLAL